MGGSTGGGGLVLAIEGGISADDKELFCILYSVEFQYEKNDGNF